MAIAEPPGLRERILDEATRLFVSRGYLGISMREIAECVGVSKASLYYHFKDKEDLLLAILSTNLQHATSMIEQAVHDGTTAREQIAGLMRALFEQAPEQRAVMRLASQELPHLCEEARDRCIRRYQEEFVGRIEVILRTGIQRGELRPIDPHLGTWILLGMAYPFFYPAHMRELGPPGAALDVMLAIFFDGTTNAVERFRPTHRLPDQDV